ncbi:MULTISPECIES: hypothetical protein [Metabacillus]|uniref:Uncharacterized protein n=2 Tax=Metabacillus TaxID=2675233 RepID=A0A179T6X6_9BACI|nr:MULTISPECIES: hypothetical protein [Metabacillus]OAS88202.1 hypothetical protein A6K24_17665 [Metabacillus litoralis]QNF27367.1 hypothetical protein HUW50_07465 [Metabacillus sp. KUDC1714]
MSLKNDNGSLNINSRRVLHKVNKNGDVIELEILKFDENAIATICQDKPPFKDYLAEAKEQFKRLTAKKALK